MNKEFTQEQKYILAKKRVEKISKFYKHLATYIIINVFLSAIFIVGDMNDGDTFNEAVSDYHNYKIWLYWGIGIVFQALNTFGLNLFMNKDWEQKKIQKYMDEQNNRR
ncbi:2TM domain-containing protein [Polaribacter sp. MSW13]|uniref:2TM domain-containing protein n=1 Tax=Polaribacter marinus TaxID=2916838 RepID=A0A9X2AJ21_9FLAO|nr:2TM domain-containing protein [Polaribacter marinus]MCI2227953.1 2TM domain-containing protein [Polaribacter marinus]